MANKTNCVINGTSYYRVYRTVGKKIKNGVLLDDRKVFYGKNKSEAEAKYQAYIAKQKSGFTSEELVGVLLNDWIDTVFKFSERKNSTKYKYIQAYNKLFRDSKLASTPINEVSALDLQKLYNENMDKPSNVRALHNLLRDFYRYTDVNGIARDITASMKIQKRQKSGKKEVEVWEDADLKRLIDSLEGHRYRLLVVLAVNTGARISELLALTYDDIQNDSLVINKQVSETPLIDGDKQRFHITPPKSESSIREIPLSKEVLREIEKHKQAHKKEMIEKGYRTNNIFTTSTGHYYFRSSVGESLKNIYKKIGVPEHTFHSFRHTFGTNLSRMGVPMETIKELMGHSEIGVTAKYYINIGADRKREAVERIASLTSHN